MFDFKNNFLYFLSLIDTVWSDKLQVFLGRADNEDIIVEAQVFHDVMQRYKIGQLGTIVGEFGDMIVTPWRLSNSAIDIKRARLQIEEEREQISDEMLKLIEGKNYFLFPK